MDLGFLSLCPRRLKLATGKEPHDAFEVPAWLQGIDNTTTGAHFTRRITNHSMGGIGQTVQLTTNDYDLPLDRP